MSKKTERKNIRLMVKVTWQLEEHPDIPEELPEDEATQILMSHPESFADDHGYVDITVPDIEQSVFDESFGQKLFQIFARIVQPVQIEAKETCLRVNKVPPAILHKPRIVGPEDIN